LGAAQGADRDQLLPLRGGQRRQVRHDDLEPLLGQPVQQFIWSC
jgi:hypothetical protein